MSTLHYTILPHSPGPLHQLWQIARKAWTRSPTRGTSTAATLPLPLPVSRRATATTTHPVANRTIAQRTLPLRVVRVVDVETAGTPSVGRMRISGRMADVCAELDRLVEREAAFQRAALPA